MEKLPIPIKKETKRIRPRPEDVEIWRSTRAMTAEEVAKEMEKAGRNPATLEDMRVPEKLIEKLHKEGTVIIEEEKREKEKRLPKKEEPKQLPYQEKSGKGIQL